MYKTPLPLRKWGKMLTGENTGTNVIYMTKSKRKHTEALWSGKVHGVRLTIPKPLSMSTGINNSVNMSWMEGDLFLSLRLGGYK